MSDEKVRVELGWMEKPPIIRLVVRDEGKDRAEPLGAAAPVGKGAKSNVCRMFYCCVFDRRLTNSDTF